MTDNLPPADIPDLSALPAMAEWMIVSRGIAGRGAADSTAFALQMNCVRLLDGAISSYERGRMLLKSFHTREPSTFGLGFVVSAGTSFECCIWHFERFIKHARALRSSNLAELALRGLIPSKLGFLAQSVESRVTKLRHTLAHLEGAAVRGEVSQGTSIALMPLELGLTVGSHQISWPELSAWLTEAHATVVALANFKPGTDASGA
jgi:hypothetical protein